MYLVGFLGAHQFCCVRPISVTTHFFTLDLFFIGWIVNLFLILKTNREAVIRFNDDAIDFNVAWPLLTFVSLLSIQSMRLGKWLIGLLYLCTTRLCSIGWLYDLWTLNNQIILINNSRN